LRKFISISEDGMLLPYSMSLMWVWETPESLEDFILSRLRSRKTAMGVNGALYPALAKKDATPNKLHSCKDLPACL
jgi:hypothetical protein